MAKGFTSVAKDLCYKQPILYNKQLITFWQQRSQETVMEKVNKHLAKDD